MIKKEKKIHIAIDNNDTDNIDVHFSKARSMSFKLKPSFIVENRPPPPSKMDKPSLQSAPKL